MKATKEIKPPITRKVSIIRRFWNKALSVMSQDKQERNRAEIERLMARDVVKARQFRRRERELKIGIFNDTKRSREFYRYQRYLGRERKQLERCRRAMQSGRAVKRPTKLAKLKRHEEFHALEIERMKKILFGDLMVNPLSA